MFAFRLQAMRVAFQEHLPDVWAGLKRITADWNTPDFAAELAREFPRLPKISIDKGVMEKLRGTLMLPLPLDWDDVGSWSALERLREADKAGNVVDGRAVVLDAQNNLLASDEGCVVAVKGVDGLIVVHTADATLVCRRDDDQGVKALVKELEAIEAEHKDWVVKLKKSGINISSGYLIDDKRQPGGGGILIFFYLMAIK